MDKIKSNRLICDALYPEWVSNPVIMRKSKEKWWICVDHSGLNKMNPKDNFPLPKIDQLVDSTAGHKLLSFMDGYSECKQILVHILDLEHTDFVTDLGLYCSVVMSFRFELKDVGATYQRLVNRMYEDKIGRSMEIYVDNMLVKSRKSNDHIDDLAKMFSVLQNYGIKLNPLKCSFEIASRKFLSFIVNFFIVTPAGSRQIPRRLKQFEISKGRRHLIRYRASMGRSSLKVDSPLGPPESEFSSST